MKLDDGPLSEIFKRYAKYYDHIYIDKDYKKECDFLEYIFQNFSESRVKTMLDLACGSGGHAIPLAERGYEVLGVDASEAMIEIARNKAENAGVDIKFEVMKMEELSLPEKFDVIICMFSGIDYIESYDALSEALKRIRTHLSEDGLLVFDFWNGFAVLTSFSPTRVKVAEHQGKKVIRVSRTELDAIKQICKVDFDCTVLEGNFVIDHFQEKHDVRFYFPEEIKNYLSEAGLRTMKICPFMDLHGRMDEKIWNLTVIAKIR